MSDEVETQQGFSDKAVGTEKRSEETAEGEGHYRVLLNAITDALFVHEIREDGAPGRFIEVNDVACARLGYTRQELLKMSPLDIDAPDSEVDAGSVRQRVLAGESVTFEQTHVARDGRRIPVEVNANLFRLGERPAVLSLVRDISDRKRVEEALRISEERFQLAMRGANDGLWDWDLKTDEVYFSPRWKSMLGYAEDELEHHLDTWKRVVHPDDRESTLAFVRDFMEGRSDKYEVEFRLRHKEGRYLNILSRAFLVRDAQGVAVRLVGTHVDITERRLLEAEQLKRHKLEAIGTLAGGIAHDFNNLLQGVFGYMSMAKMNLDRKERALAMLEQAEKALGMSVSLAGQLLTFSKGGKPVKKSIALQPVIENSVKFALSGSRSNYRITLAAGLWHAEADEGQIGQVIQNIVLNASESMPTGGTVTISAGNVELSRGGNSLLPAGGKFVRIAIEDSGVGIPEQYQARIFDPYFTTKQKGSGLGLATAYAIVRNHGGVIDVASEANRGSTFYIYLPAGRVVEKAETPPPPPAAGRKGKILVMDDEDLVRTVAVEMIEALGHEAEGAAEGGEAIEKFRLAGESGTPFDLVILDLTVKGGMGGEEAVRKLCDMAPAVKAIVSSGYADNTVVSDYRSYGFSAFLNKPYRIDALRECLDKLLASE